MTQILFVVVFIRNLILETKNDLFLESSRSNLIAPTMHKLGFLTSGP
jgi:hypothetical protein